MSLQKIAPFVALVLSGSLLFTYKSQYSKTKGALKRTVLNPTKSSKKKTTEERNQFHEARVLHEFYRQADPATGKIPRQETLREKAQAQRAPLRNARNNYLGIQLRGPNNLGGRTRSLVIDRSDATGNTMLAGAVSGGVFKTTDGGSSWTKVSSRDEIHNVTCLVQDPRTGFENTWYYGTGEALGNSTSKTGAFYLGRGIWQSTDGGLSWSQMTSTNSVQENFDSRFDIVNRLAVHPTTGELYAAVLGAIRRFDGTNWNTELSSTNTSTANTTDILFSSTGRAYASFAGLDGATRGVWSSATGNGGWSRIGTNGTPAAWAQNTGSGRCVLAMAPSNNNIVYALYVNNNAGAIEADLFRWNQATSSWANFSGKLPDEGVGLTGNDPFAVQGGYDLVVSVKPDDANFVVIGGTNVYKISNILASPEFERIGGYDAPSTYALWNNGGGDTHHPDIHALVFDPFNSERLYSGSDGGVHRTSNISTTTAGSTAWTNLNNDYQSYQYYYVAIDPQTGSDIVIGGAQDNGTTAGGTGFGLPDRLTHSSVFSGDGAACAISRDDPCTPFFMTTQNGSIFRDCPSFANITPTGSSSQFVTYFYMDPDNNETVYYAGEGDIYRTNASSTVTQGTWTNIGGTNAFGHSDFFQSFATTRGTYNAGSSYLLAGGDEGHIYRLDNPKNNNFTSAVDITPAGASTTFPSIVSGLAIHPTNSDIAMAVYSNYGISSIFLTTNATATSPTWTLVEQNLSAHSIRSVAIVEQAGNTAYFVGTARGIYSNDDPINNNWVREGAATVGFAVVSSLAYRPSDHTLLIGTHGNGMFEAAVQLNTLSYEKLDLRAIAINRDEIKVEWTTLNERYNDYFEVERSIDGENFEVIARQNSAANDQGNASYQVMDEFLADLQYYRIVTVEQKGNKIYSRTVAIERKDNALEKISLYPNPAKDYSIIRRGKVEGDLNIILYSIKGQIVLEKMLREGNNQLRIDLRELNLRPGMYIMQCERDGVLLTTEKLIQQ